MNLIVAVMWVCVAYNLVYSVWVQLTTNKSCSPVAHHAGINIFFKFSDRFVSYLVWVWPIIYLFWPTIKN